jgi:hypothetical protein
MPKEDNQFEWGEWDDNSQDNTPEENNAPKNDKQLDIQWGDEDTPWDNNSQENKGDEQFNWGDGNENEVNIDNDNLFSLIGKTSELYYNGYLYNLNCDNNKIKDELKTIPLNIKEKDGRFDFSPTPDSELGKLIECILKMSADEHNLRIIDCNVIKCGPNESFLNIFSGKLPFNFLYVAQSNNDVGEIVLDFSAMGGPSFNTRKYEEGSLILIPGWVPYRISKNNSQQDHILIAGMLG